MKKILIIEDDSAIAEIEKDYLTLSGRMRQSSLTEKRGWKKRKAAFTT